MLRRGIFYTLAFISGLCLLATLIVWPVSYHYYLHGDYKKPSGTSYDLHAARGRIQWSYARSEVSASPFGLSVHAVAVDTPAEWSYVPWERVASPRYNRVSVLGIWWVHDPDVPPYYACDVAVPCSVLAILLSVLPVLAFRARRRRFRGQGLCRHCGYDLRAHHTGDICPECGTPITASQ